MAQRSFYIAVRHLMARAASSTPPQIPLGDETPGNTQPRGNKLQGQTLGQTKLQGEQQQRPRRTKQRLKWKQQEQRSWKTKVKTQTKTTPNLQGCGQNEDVKINDNRKTSTGNRTRDHMGEKAAPLQAKPSHVSTNQQKTKSIERPTSKGAVGKTSRTRFMEDHEKKIQWKRKLPTSKGEANKAGFSSGM